MKTIVPQGIINIIKNIYGFQNPIDKVVERAYENVDYNGKYFERDTRDFQVNCYLEDNIEGMTVKEVIEYFQKFEPNLKLLMEDGISLYEHRDETDIEWAQRLYLNYFRQADIELSKEKQSRKSLMEEKKKLLAKVREIDFIIANS